MVRRSSLAGASRTSRPATSARSWPCARHAGAANGEINRELAALKRMYTLAVQAGKLHAKPYIPMLQEDNVRRGFFEREQLEATCAALPAALRPVVTFAYLTGWRVMSEILPLERRQVDWDGRVVRLDPVRRRTARAARFPLLRSWNSCSRTSSRNTRD
jgi:integrase